MFFCELNSACSKPTTLHFFARFISSLSNLPLVGLRGWSGFIGSHFSRVVDPACNKYHIWASFLAGTFRGLQNNPPPSPAPPPPLFPRSRVCRSSLLRSSPRIFEQKRGCSMSSNWFFIAMIVMTHFEWIYWQYITVDFSVRITQLSLTASSSHEGGLSMIQTCVTFLPYVSYTSFKI